MVSYPKILKKAGEYDMELIGDNQYWTTRPEALVRTIGSKKPKKKIFTYQELIDNNYYVKTNNMDKKLTPTEIFFQYLGW